MDESQGAALATALWQMDEKEFLAERIGLPPAQNMFDWHRRVFTGYAEALVRSRKGAKTVPALWIDRPDFNARAFCHSGHDFIALNWGTVIVLQDLFFRMLASPSVLPQVGDPSAEQEGDNLPRLETDAARLAREEGIPLGLTVGPAIRCERNTPFSLLR